MNRKHEKQSGIGITGIFVLILALGFGTLFAFKVGTPYWEHKNISDKVALVLAEAKLEPALTESNISERIVKRVSIDNLNISGSNIDIQPTAVPGEWVVSIPVVTKIRLWDGAALVIELPVVQRTKK